MNSQAQPELENEFPWSGSKRLVVSAAIVIYLVIVISGPATNSVSSDLTNSLGQVFEPIHQATHLGHGYRYFGHNPGQSHILKFEVGLPDKTVISGQLPDRDKHWPRQLYHRWFMLSETVFNQFNGALDRESFERTQQALTARVELMQQKGKRKFAKRLLRFQRERGEKYEQNMKRIDELVNAIGQHLIREHEGAWVKLSVHAREIPYPEDVILGEELGAPERITDPFRIWTIERED